MSATAENANAIFDQAQKLLQEGDVQEAIALFCTLLPQHERSHNLHYLLGNAYYQLRQPDQAKHHLEKCLNLQKTHPEANNLMGLILADSKQHQQAIEYFDRALTSAPNYVAAHYNKGLSLRALERHADAITCYNAAIALQNDYVEAYYNRGNALGEMQRWDEALASYNQALSILPNYAEAFNSRGATLSNLHRHQEAIESIHRAITLKKDYVDAYNNLAVVFLDLGQYQQARNSVTQALTKNPDYEPAHLTLALLDLLQGNYSEGWEHYEWRWKTPPLLQVARSFDQPRWTGDPQVIKGKSILVYSEQGMGDVMQFCRYIPLLAKMDAHVVFEVPPALADILQSLAGVAQMVIRHQPLPHFDYQIPLMSLPRAFQTTLKTIPDTQPYLTAPDDARTHWSQYLRVHMPQKRRRIGLCWRGNPNFPKSRMRDVPLEQLTSLFNLNADFICLQKSLTPEEQSIINLYPNVHTVETLLYNFTDTAGLIDNLDLVISSDTSVVHLAGAMGAPTWVLLSYSPDFRWLLTREDSPWYPQHMTLFRQKKPGDWQSVIKKAGFSLQSHLQVHKIPQSLPLNSSIKIEELLEQAVAKHQQGDLESAKNLYKDILKINQLHFDALHMLGVVSLQSQKPMVALDFFNQAFKIHPNNPELHYNRGNALRQLRRLEDAVEAYNRTIGLHPQHIAAYINKGNSLQNLKKLPEALACYKQAIEISPNNETVHNNLGNVLLDMGNYEEALACYERALALQPDYEDALLNRGNALLEMDRHADAIASYDQVLQRNPRYTLAHSHRCVALTELSRWDEALDSINAALNLEPKNVQAWNNLGNLYKRMAQPKEAVQAFQKALAINPNAIDTHINLANTMRDLGLLREAMSSYEYLMSTAPNNVLCNWNMALCALQQGDFERGWKLYEWRWKTKALARYKRSFTEPLWLGDAPISGKTILVHAEQGLGDTIQFCRYIPQLAALDAQVMFEVYPELRPLLDNIPGVTQVISQGETLPPFDTHIPLMSLPLALKTDMDTIPAHLPYIQAESAKVEQWHHYLQQKLSNVSRKKIGVAWAGNRRHINDTLRSMTLQQFSGLFDLDANFVCLQKEIDPFEKSLLPYFPNLITVEHLLNDFSDTAALIKSLDLVISIDTSVIHLSAAMNHPTWLLLPFSSDYRWLSDRQDSPWYPGILKLLRQPTPGDWKSLLQQTIYQLHEFLEQAEFIRRLRSHSPKFSSVDIIAR